MYRIINTNGLTIGMTDSVNYIKFGNSGCYTIASEAEAIGVAYKSVPYNLIGHNEIEGADTVVVIKEDVGFYIMEMLKNKANIDYISMMTGVNIPSEEEAANE